MSHSLVLITLPSTLSVKCKKEHKIWTLGVRKICSSLPKTVYSNYLSQMTSVYSQHLIVANLRFPPDLSNDSETLMVDHHKAVKNPQRRQARFYNREGKSYAPWHCASVLWRESGCFTSQVSQVVKIFRHSWYGHFFNTIPSCDQIFEENDFIAYA